MKENLWQYPADINNEITYEIPPNGVVVVSFPTYKWLRHDDAADAGEVTCLMVYGDKNQNQKIFKTKMMSFQRTNFKFFQTIDF